MHDRMLPGVEFNDPFRTQAVWQAIDKNLASDVRRGSAATVETTGSRGQARMRDAFVRRNSVEDPPKVSCWARFKAAVQDWL